MDAGTWSHRRETWAGCCSLAPAAPQCQHTVLSLRHSRAPLEHPNVFRWPGPLSPAFSYRKPRYLQRHTNMVRDRRNPTNEPGQSLRQAQCQRDRREAPLSRKVGWRRDQGPGKSFVHVGYQGTWGGKDPELRPCLLLPRVAKQEPTEQKV